MEVILLERVGKLGQMGDVVRVKDGFARNFLLPRGKALRATADNKARFEGMKAELQARNLELKGGAEKVAAKLDGKTIVVIRQASEAGQLFGSVSTARHRQPAQRRRRRGEPLAGRAQRADQDDRPVQGAAGAASGSRDHRSPSSSRAAPAKPSGSRAARTSRCGATEAEEEAAAALASRGSLLRAGSGQGLARRRTEARRKPRPAPRRSLPSRRQEAGRPPKRRRKTKTAPKIGLLRACRSDGFAESRPLCRRFGRRLASRVRLRFGWRLGVRTWHRSAWPSAGLSDGFRLFGSALVFGLCVFGLLDVSDLASPVLRCPSFVVGLALLGFFADFAFSSLGLGLFVALGRALGGAPCACAAPARCRSIRR